MTEKKVYGGLGGIDGFRGIDKEDKFEVMISKIFGERMKAEDELCQQIWGALANVEWYKPSTSEEASYSFRAAGDLIAAIRGAGNYMDWYCNYEYASITDEIRRAFKKEGWIADDMSEICDENGCLDDVTCGWTSDDGYRNTCSNHKKED